MEVGACAQRGLSRCPDGHVIDQAVNGHPQAAGCRGGGHHGVILDITPALTAAQIIHRALKAHADVALQHRGGRLALAQKHRLALVQTVESVYDCGGRADLCHQNVNFHRKPFFLSGSFQLTAALHQEGGVVDTLGAAAEASVGAHLNGDLRSDLGAANQEHDAVTDTHLLGQTVDVGDVLVVDIIVADDGGSHHNQCHWYGTITNGNCDVL